METVDCNAPRVKAAARQLEITIVLRAWEDDGVLYIQDPWGTYEVAGAQEARDDTLPKAEGSGLDDFTAIAGVGPKTAQRLHDLELYTYDDVRDWLARLRAVEGEEEGFSEHTLSRIEGWLAERLV